MNDSETELRVDSRPIPDIWENDIDDNVAEGLSLFFHHLEKDTYDTLAAAPPLLRADVIEQIEFFMPYPRGDESIAHLATFHNEMPPAWRSDLYERQGELPASFTAPLVDAMMIYYRDPEQRSIIWNTSEDDRQDIIAAIHEANPESQNFIDPHAVTSALKRCFMSEEKRICYHNNKRILNKRPQAYPPELQKAMISAVGELPLNQQGEVLEDIDAYNVSPPEFFKTIPGTPLSDRFSHILNVHGTGSDSMQMVQCLKNLASLDGDKRKELLSRSTMKNREQKSIADAIWEKMPKADVESFKGFVNDLPPCGTGYALKISHANLEKKFISELQAPEMEALKGEIVKLNLRNNKIIHVVADESPASPLRIHPLSYQDRALYEALANLHPGKGHAFDPSKEADLSLDDGRYTLKQNGVRWDIGAENEAFSACRERLPNTYVKIDLNYRSQNQRHKPMDLVHFNFDPSSAPKDMNTAFKALFEALAFDLPKKRQAYTAHFATKVEDAPEHTHSGHPETRRPEEPVRRITWHGGR